MGQRGTVHPFSPLPSRRPYGASNRRWQPPGPPAEAARVCVRVFLSSQSGRVAVSYFAPLFPGPCSGCNAGNTSQRRGGHWRDWRRPPGAAAAAPATSALCWLLSCQRTALERQHTLAASRSDSASRPLCPAASAAGQPQVGDPSRCRRSCGRLGGAHTAREREPRRECRHVPSAMRLPTCRARVQR